MTDLLTPAEASPIAGVPAVQLMRWAWLRVGPRNSGTRHRPKYHVDDLREWREAQHAIERRAMCDVVSPLEPGEMSAGLARRARDPWGP